MVHVHIRVLNCAEIRWKQPLILSLNFILKQEIQSEWKFEHFHVVCFIKIYAMKMIKVLSIKRRTKVFVFRNYERKNMAVVAGQQIIFIPPWRLILPLIFLEIRVSFASVLYFSFWRLILITVRYHHMSLLKHLLGQ